MCEKKHGEVLSPSAMQEKVLSLEFVSTPIPPSRLAVFPPSRLVAVLLKVMTRNLRMIDRIAGMVMANAEATTADRKS